MPLRRAAVGFYSILLTAFPQRHRDRYSEEMVEAFEREQPGDEHPASCRQAREVWNEVPFEGKIGVDDLQGVVEENRRSRHEAALEAEEIVDADAQTRGKEMDAILAERGDHPGLVHIFSAMETCYSCRREQRNCNEYTVPIFLKLNLRALPNI